MPSEKPAASLSCFHCGQAVPDAGRWSVEIAGSVRPMCCAGCQAVARAILDAGLADYYQHRSGPADGRATVPAQLDALELYDDSEVQSRFARHSGGEGGGIEASLAVEGMQCGACVWLLERTLAAEPGVLSASINYATERALIRWDPKATRLSHILARFQAVGYRAVPFDAKRREEAIARTSKTQFRRLFIAGIAMMQVMMFALPGYTSAPGDIDWAYEHLMRWASLVLTTPVVLYSAAPFFTGAWRDLRTRRPGMDVPVAIGIGVAFAASAWATISAQGQVYFDSVTMFVFLLLGARYLEWIARRRAGRALDVIATAAPEQVQRVRPDDSVELVAALRLAPGDRIRIDHGERIAVDARLQSTSGAVDLSLLTGESEPVPVRLGDEVPGGAVNRGAPLLLDVLRDTGASTLSTIERLIERSAQDKPRLAQLADRFASWFVAALLVFTLLVLAAWSLIDPARALTVAISVLVVSCPCALSLATPTALAAATGSLLRRHILVTRGHTLEALAKCTDVVFDKTGTLTLGRPEVVSVQPDGGADPLTMLSWAAALDAGAAHPFAAAIVAMAERAGAPSTSLIPESRHDESGFGVTADLRDDDGALRRLALGSAAWCALGQTQAQALRDEPCWRAGPEPLPTTAPSCDGSEVFLVERLGEGRVRALMRLALTDSVRTDAHALIAQLQARGLRVHLLSGDRPAVVGATAGLLGIAHWRAEAKPDDKLAFVQALQHDGAQVLMVGDGINDGPVLAAADVSIAVGRASALARSAADAILLTPALAGISTLLDTASRTLRIMHQNLGWAAAYNLAAIPAAALGYVPPWLAALGMSASSLLVALNALRLWAWKRSSS